MNAKTIVAIAMVVSGVALYQASNWWERAFATLESSELSPDGCIRVNAYKPYWVLPTFLHRIPDPDPTVHYDLGISWEAPTFQRAWEERTGAFMGETIVYEPYQNNFIDWGDPKSVGRRIVSVNSYPFVDSPLCSDKSTLSLLEAAYRRKRQGTWAADMP